MNSQYASIFSRFAADARKRCLLSVGVKHHECLSCYYATKQKNIKPRPPAVMPKEKTKRYCKQFTTVSKVLNGFGCKTYGTNKKVSVIGLETIGVATVFALVTQNITDNICLVDLDEDIMKGELLDLKMGGLFNDNANIIASKDPADTADSKICIIFTGTYKGKDEHPDIFAARSVAIIKALIPPLLNYSPKAKFVIASDPVDILSYASWKISGLPKSHIIGTGTMADTAKFRYLLSQKMGISPLDCHGYIIGERGENSVPVWSGVNIAGVPLKEINKKIGTKEDSEDWREVFIEAVHCDNYVRSLKGYNSWAYALAISNLCHAVLNNKNAVMPLSTHALGEHAIRDDVFLSLPCVVGENGITDIIRITLSDEEAVQLRKCAENVAGIQHSVPILT